MAIDSGTAGSIVWAGTIVLHTSRWEMNLAHNTPDVTPQGVAWEEFIAGVRGAKFTVDFDTELTGLQLAIQTAVLNGTSGSARFYNNATNYYEAGTVYVNSERITSAVKDAGRGSWEFTASGPISFN